MGGIKFLFVGYLDPTDTNEDDQKRKKGCRTFV